MASALLLGVRRADDKAFVGLFFHIARSENAWLRGFQEMPSFSILSRAALLDNLPINTYIRVIQSVIPKVDDSRKFEIAHRAMGRCLRNRFDGDEAAVPIDAAWHSRRTT